MGVLDQGMLAAIMVLGIVAAGITVFAGDAVETAGVESFSSPDDFRDYVSAGVGTGTVQWTTQFDRVETAVREDSMAAPMDGATGDAATPRYSGTNVQVMGIDEPDIVKTDGTSIFYARNQYYTGNTTVIDASPAGTATITAGIDATGTLLLDNGTLVVLSQSYRDPTVSGYDVGTPEQPDRMWRMPVNGTVETARMYNGVLYLVVRDRIDTSDPCPIRPVTTSSPVTVPCSRVFHPVTPVNVDVTYTVLTVDPDTGEVGETASVVGTSRNSVVYMSENALYLTYTRERARGEIMMAFLTGEGGDLLDTATRQRIQQVQGYDLSPQARLVELQSIIENYRGSLDPDARRAFDTRMRNRFGNYTKEHAREYQRTGITKIGLTGLTVEATGEVPGRPLNQFSLDEHNGDLRIATTVDAVGSWGTTGSVNDVYVLDEALSVQGSVTGMGLNEQVYSVRFIGDKGYVVTFRRIDPFHVLDLSDPEHPELTGELKLPGFSSYLHPLPNDQILGVGEEDGQVKAVVFDVSDPEQPEVASDYVLDEYWSSIRSTHHAFLHDPKHDVFFIPASRGGYIFSYKQGLELEKAVDMTGVQRAVYIDDYMYVFGQSELVVLDETSWERVKTLKLGTEHPKPVPLPEPIIIDEARLD